MDYNYVDCNIPRFSFEDMKKQISKAGNVEWKSKKEIQKEHIKYNTEGKADVIGWISEELAKEIIGVTHFLYVVTLGHIYVFTLPNGCVVTCTTKYN